jgi:hypothetical protein
LKDYKIKIKCCVGAAAVPLGAACVPSPWRGGPASPSVSRRRRVSLRCTTAPYRRDFSDHRPLRIWCDFASSGGPTRPPTIHHHHRHGHVLHLFPTSSVIYNLFIFVNLILIKYFCVYVCAGADVPAQGRRGQVAKGVDRAAAAAEEPARRCTQGTHTHAHARSAHTHARAKKLI